MGRRRATLAELGALLLVLAGQAFLFARSIRGAANYDEGVYLASLDALRHGQALGSDVFAAQFPGFYDLLRGLSYVTGIGVVPIRAGLLAVVLAGTVGGWLVGRRFGGRPGGILVAILLTIAPPLDLFGAQVIADMPALALTLLALGLATLAGPVAAVAAGVGFAAALSVKLTAVTVFPALVWVLRDRLVPAAAGFAALAALLVAVHAHALGDLWTSGVTYHREARDTAAVIPHPHRQIVDQIPHATPMFVLACAAIVVMGVAVTLRRELGLWPLWSWVVLGVGFLLMHGPLHYNHLVLFPYSLAVATGATLGAVVDRLRRRRLPHVAAMGLLGVAAAAGWVQQLHRVDATRSGEAASNRAAAAALRRLTPRGAMTVDDRPLVSFLAGRRVAGPVVDLARLRFETGSLDDAAVIDAVGRADAVVISRELRRHPRVLASVRERFDRRYDRGGVAIWVRR